MTRSLSLIYLIGFCLLQFSLSSAQSLPLAENTPQEIGAAISQNSVNVLKAFLQLQRENLKAQVENLPENHPKKEFYTFYTAILQSIDPYWNVVNYAIDSAVTKILASAWNSQANGEDIGLVVGASVVHVIEDLSFGAKFISRIVQKKIDEPLAKFEDCPERLRAILLGLGGAFERFISLINAKSNTIEALVAVIVNDGVSQGGSTADIIGNTVTVLLQVFADNIGNIRALIGNTVIDVVTGIDNISQEDVKIVTYFFEKLSLKFRDGSLENFATSFGKSITSIIVKASTEGFKGEGEAKDAVEVINRIGNYYLQHFKS